MKSNICVLNSVHLYPVSKATSVTKMKIGYLNLTFFFISSTFVRISLVKPKSHDPKSFSFQASSDKLSIQVYYESLCSDSKNFITTQLYPTYQKLGNYLKVDFKPFGNADVSILDSNIYQDTKPFFPSVHTRFQWGLDI